jgi:hypothetical protein
VAKNEEEEFMGRWGTAPTTDMAKELWATNGRVRTLTVQVEGLLKVTREKGESDTKVKETLTKACGRIVALEKEVGEVTKQGDTLKELKDEIQVVQSRLGLRMQTMEKELSLHDGDLKAQGQRSENCRGEWNEC